VKGIVFLPHIPHLPLLKDTPLVAFPATYSEVRMRHSLITAAVLTNPLVWIGVAVTLSLVPAYLMFLYIRAELRIPPPRAMPTLKPSDEPATSETPAPPPTFQPRQEWDTSGTPTCHACGMERDAERCLTCGTFKPGDESTTSGTLAEPAPSRTPRKPRKTKEHHTVKLDAAEVVSDAVKTKKKKTPKKKKKAPRQTRKRPTQQ
jgi:hypothetical protein